MPDARRIDALPVSGHANVVKPRPGTEHTGNSESGCEGPASQVDDNWLCVGTATGEDSAKSLGKFLQMPQLVVIGVEQDTVIGTQIRPWFIEVCLTSTHDLTHRSFGVYPEIHSCHGAGVVLHALSDLGASQVC